VFGIWLFGGLGALARYGVDRGFPLRIGLRFPWAIFLVNVSGAFAIGLLAALFTGRFADAQPWLKTALTVGFLGGYTTFSTFSLDTFRLLDAGRVAAAFGNGLGSLALGVLAAWVGLRVGRLA